MKNASLVLSDIGALASCCGTAGLDGLTPVGCVVVTLVGMTMFFAGCVLREVDKSQKKARAKALSRREKRKDEFFEVWEACQITE